MRRNVLIALALPAAILTFAVASGATTASLPGGTAITVSISSPADNSTLPDAPFTVTGSASVGVGVAVPDTTLVYIVDISGSTSSSDGTPSRCPRQNVYDSLADTTLDCELLAVRDLNHAAILTGTVAKIGMIGFAGTNTDTLSPLNITSAAALDLTPGGVVGTLTEPNANTFTPTPGMTTVFAPQNNLDWAVQSAYLGGTALTSGLIGWPARGAADGFTQFSTKDVGTGTNYYAALAALKALTASITTSKTVVAFLSDGFANLTVQSHALAEALNALNPSTMKIYTFAVGASAGCGSATPSTFGSLAQISARFGTTCQLLTDPADAADVVPSVIASQLTGLTLTVNGAPQAGVTITPALPRTGPSTVSFSKMLTLPPGGPYAICATASGKDGAGPGSAGPDCIHVTIKAPPTVTFGGGVGPVPEGTAAPVSATVNGATTTQWSSSGGTGHCTFADPTVVSTSVTCDDNGTYTLTLTVSDGVNPAPVSASETLEVTNVAPVPTLTVSPGTIPLHGTVNAHTTIVDPGTNDTQTCSNAWGDGSLPTPGCDDSHVYNTAGTYTVTTTATDDDGGTGTSTATVIVNGPPAVTVSDASGAEGSTIQLSATAIDAEHDTLSYHWTATAASGVDPGTTCGLIDPTALTPTVTCNDDGTWTITLTVSDNVNIDVITSGTLTVSNVNPVPTLTVSPGTIPLHGTVNAHTTIVDPGTIDTQTCSNAWGDGSTTTGCDDSHVYNTAGTYTVTTTASDGEGGTGTSTALVVVNGPPTVTVSDASGAEGSAIQLSATATDAEHDPLSYHWTATAGANVDAGATCAFSNDSILTPSISCTDDGTWTLTLTVSDNVNIDVVAHGTLTVSNANPTAALTLTPGSIPLHGSVLAHAAITDPGTNDTQSCSIDWGDGTPATAGCDSGHTYDIPGPHVVTVTVTDDDGGTATATAGVLVNAPPVVHVSDAAGSEGAAIPVTATATDAEHDALTYAWTATPVGSVDAGAACAFGNPLALATTVTCTDDGAWTITLGVSDGVNPAVSSSGTLTVANAAPTLHVSNPAAGASSRNVTFNGIVTDPGSNDTQSCLINWGDGTTDTVPVAGGFCNATHSYATSLAGATIDASATDDDGGTSAHVTRVLTFNRAPVCVNVHAIPATLWPPNGKFRLVTLTGATDPDGDPITYQIVSITQDEPLGRHDEEDHKWFGEENGDHGNGKKLVPDAVRGTGPTFFLRAWRDPHGDGRVYTIAFTVTDSHGASCSGTTTVTVPHDEHHPAVKTPGVSVNSVG